MGWTKPWKFTLKSSNTFPKPPQHSIPERNDGTAKCGSSVSTPPLPRPAAPPEQAGLRGRGGKQPEERGRPVSQCGLPCDQLLPGGTKCYQASRVFQETHCYTTTAATLCQCHPLPPRPRTVMRARFMLKGNPKPRVLLLIVGCCTIWHIFWYW